MKTYFSLLDAVRFFAAFWVMNFHYLFGQTGNLEWYRYGNLGVQLFFIISGFVIVQSLNLKTLKEFSVNRFLRLFPLFWILCTATYLITIIIPNTITINFTEYLRSMTMLGDLFNGIVGYTRLIDPSYWTLTVELIFYIGIGVFSYFFSNKNIRYFLGFWLLFSVLSFIFKIDHNFYTKLLLVRHASYFAFGGALALIVTKNANNIFNRYFDWLLLFTSALYATYIHPRSLEPYYTANPLDIKIITILHIAFFIIIPLLVFLSPHVKNAKVIRVGVSHRCLRRSRGKLHLRAVVPLMQKVRHMNGRLMKLVVPVAKVARQVEVVGASFRLSRSRKFKAGQRDLPFYII